MMVYAELIRQVCWTALYRACNRHMGLRHADLIGSRGSTKGNSNNSSGANIKVGAMLVDEMIYKVAVLQGFLTMIALDLAPFLSIIGQTTLKSMFICRRREVTMQVVW